MSKLQKCLVLVASILIYGTMCLGHLFGNLSTYLYSVFHFQDHGHSFDIDPSWMLSTLTISYSVGAFAVGFLKIRIGLLPICAIGSLIYVLGIFTTYFTLFHSTWALTLTLMGFSGFGSGLAGTSTLAQLPVWFGSRIGLVTGIVTGSVGCGGIIFNLAITAFVNPNNLSPDTIDGQLHLFSQSGVIDRVPTVILLIGGITAITLAIGLCILVYLRNADAGEILGLLDEQKFKEENRESCTYGSYRKAESTKREELPFSSSDLSTLSAGKDGNHDVDGHDEKVVKRKWSYTEKGSSMTPMQVLKCELFYIVQCVLASESIGYLTVFNYYKLFGEVWIEDDQFLALTGSLSSLCIILAPVGYGTLVDLVGIKNPIIGHLATRIVLMAFWYFTAMTNKWLYMIFTVTLNSLSIIQNIMFPLITMKLFGPNYFPTNFGLVQLGSFFTNICSPPLLVIILSKFGWFWLFTANAFLALFIMTLVILRIPSV